MQQCGHNSRCLRSFLGSVGYYWALIRDFASYAARFTPAVSLSAHHMVQLTWEMEEAFGKLHESLCGRVVLQVYSF